MWRKLLFLLCVLNALNANAAMRRIRGEGMAQEDAAALNVNFEAIARQDMDSLHKTSTETVQGSKIFTATTTFQAGVNMATVGGNVGIGTASPGQKLDVRGGAVFQGLPTTQTLINSLFIGGGNSTIQGAHYIAQGPDASTLGGHAWWTAKSDSSSGAIKMVLQGDGNVGIGTTSPGALLSVVGGSIFHKQTITLSSSADVNGASGTGYIALVRDNDNSGTALILYDNGNAPQIITQTGGTVFVTGAPAATQIQVKDATGKLSFRGGSSRNGTTLNIATYIVDLD